MLWTASMGLLLQPRKWAPFFGGILDDWMRAEFADRVAERLFRAAQPCRINTGFSLAVER
jgi:hypothetical protein